MQVKILPHVGKLFLRAFLFLLLVSLVLAIFFLGTAWLNDSLELPSFIGGLLDQRKVPTSLTIYVVPEDARILLNDQPYNPEKALIPGDYLVQVSHDHFFPVEETIRIHQNKHNEFYFRLLPIVTIQELSQYAMYPGWDEQNNLYYFDFSESKIYSALDKTPLDTVNIYDVGALHRLIYSSTGNQAVAVASEGMESSSELFSINFQTGEITELSVTGFVSAGQDGTFWGLNNPDTDGEKPIWKIMPGGDPLFYPLENQEWAIDVEQVLVDPSEKWLAIGGAKGIAVWDIASGKLLATFENAHHPVWIQDPKPGLAYLSEDQSLNFAQADFNWSSVMLAPNISSLITGMSAGPEIIYARFNPFVGGTSFWAIDTTTMGVRLLSEAKAESGLVEQFSLSPDGKKIAFVNQQNVLFLVTLEP